MSYTGIAQLVFLHLTKYVTVCAKNCKLVSEFRLV
jgi:hypothetical protein